MKLMSQKRYRELLGVHCPKCNSTDISTNGLEPSGTFMFQNVDCHNCGSEWVDQYELTKYSDFKTKEDK